MTPWHLALALAAGQIVGQIQSTSGRTFLIKGEQTFKRKDRSVTSDVDANGDVCRTVVMVDKFVPVINAIEFTPDHRLGQIVRIQLSASATPGRASAIGRQRGSRVQPEV